MKVFKIITGSLAGIIFLLFLLVAGRYYSLSARERADLWFTMQKRHPQGSAEEQWYLARAIDADPFFAKALMEKSIAHNKRGDYAAGFALLDRAVEADPVGYLGYRGYVKCYMLRDYEGAIVDWERLDTLTPGVTDAPWGDDIYYALGIARKQLGDYEGALREFDRSIAGITADRGEDWVEVRTFLYRGNTLAVLDRHEEAVAAYDRGIHYFPGFTEAWYYRSLSLLALNRTEEACASLARARQFFQDGYLFTNAYYELPDQVYLSDIEALIEQGCS